jgi:hypothetical protein
VSAPPTANGRRDATRDRCSGAHRSHAGELPAAPEHRTNEGREHEPRERGDREREHRDEPEWVGVSDDLATIAIPDGDVLRHLRFARARVRTTIKGWPDSPMSDNCFLYAPIFASLDRMIVWYSWTPVSEQGRIFDMSGKQLAIIGGKGFSALGPDLDSWLVQGTEWAIKGEGNTLVTVDVQHPRVTSTYDLSDLLAQPRPPKDSDTGILDVLAVAGTAKRLVIVTGENPVTIGVLDRVTRKLVKIEPPRCRLRLALRHSGR